MNVSVSLNVNVTNNFDYGAGGNVSDAVLIINENNCTTPASGGSTFSCGPDPRFQDPQFGVIPDGVLNRLEWNEVSFPIPGAEEGPGSNTFFPLVTSVRVTAMRGNAAQLGVPDTQVFPSTQIRAFISITGPTTISLNNNDLNVAIPILGLIVTAGDPVNGLQCIDGHVSTSITVEEGFATAFKTLGFPTFFPGNTQWESGYYAPGSNNGGGAQQGTRFLVRFFNIPEGLELSFENEINHYTVASAMGSLYGPNAPVGLETHIELANKDQCIIQSPLWTSADNTDLNNNALSYARLVELKASCSSDSLHIQRVSGADADGENGSLVTSGGTYYIVSLKHILSRRPQAPRTSSSGEPPEPR